MSSTTFSKSGISQALSNQGKQGVRRRNVILRSALKGLLLAGLIQSPALAVNWDAGSGTDFLWSTATNWAGDVEPTATDDVVFPTPILNPGSLPSPEVITLSAGEFAKTLTFNDSYRLEGGDLTLEDGITGTGGISVALDKTATINSAIAGASDTFSKSGAGTLVLGGFNTFAGRVSIVGGTLTFSNSYNLGDGGASNTLRISNGATLKISGGTTDLGANRTLLIGAGGAVLEADSTGEMRFSAAVTGSAVSLSKKGAGRVILSADSSAGWVNSTVTVDAGQLQITNLKALGANSTGVTVNTSGVLELNPAATGTLDNNVTLAGGTLVNMMNLANSSIAFAAGRTLTIGSDSTVQVDGPLLNGKITLPGAALNGSGKLTKTGPGTLLLQGANGGFSGAWDITAGIVEAQNTTALGSGMVTLNGGELVNTGASANTPTNSLIANSGSLSANSGNNSNWQGTIDVPGSLTILGRDFNSTGTARTFTVSGAISGAGNIDIRGITSTTAAGGVVILSGNNASYTGKITVYDTATLRLTSSTAAGDTSQGIELINTAFTGGAGVTLELNSTAGITVSDPLTMNSNTTPGNRSALRNTGPNTYAGPITLQGNGLNQFYADSGTLTVTGAVGGGSFTGTLFLRGTANGIVGAGGIDIPGATVSKTDASTWTIMPGPSAHSWGNTVVAVGTLAMGGANVLPPTTVVTMGQNDTNGSTLNLAGFSQTVGAVVLNSTGGTKNVTSGPNAILTVNPTSTLGYVPTGNGNPTMSGAGLGLTKIGTSVYVLGGPGITYQGPTTIDGGILSLNNTGNFVSNIINNTALALDGTTVWTFNGKVMAGAGTLQKDGTGVAIIANPLLHTGGTTVAVGALEMSNPVGTLVNSSLSVNGGVVQSSGVYAPVLGTGVGQLAFAGNGGFGAGGASDLRVNVGGVLSPLTWGTTSNFIGNGQTLIFGSALSTRTVNFQNPLVLDGARTIAAESGSSVVSANLAGVISDGAMASSLTKTGAGILMLSGNNTYSGGTTISAGVLRVSNANALGTGNTVINGGVLDIESNTSIDLGAGAGQVQVIGTTSGFGGGGLRGPVTLTLNPSSSNNVTWGTADFDPANLVLGSIGSNQPLTLASHIDLNNATRTVQVDGLGNAVPATIGGVISNSGATGQLKKTGAGTLALTGANTFTGGISLDAGNLQLTNTGNVGGGTLTFNGGTLRWAPGVTADLSSKFAAVASGKTASLDTNGNNITLATAVTGAGGLAKGGVGTLTLQATNTYTGATAVNRGTLALNFAAASAPASNIISASSALSLGGGTLSVLGKASTTNAQTFASTSLTAGQSAISGTIGTSGTVNITLGAITRSVGSGVVFTKPATGNIITSTALTNGALGGWALFGNTDFATTSSSNVQALGATTALPATGSVATTNYTLGANLTLTAASLANTLRLTGTGFTVTMAANNLTLTAGGGLMYTGASGNTFTLSGTGIVGAGAANEFMVSVPNSGANLTINAPVIGAGAGSLTKLGAGDLRLGNASSFTGKLYVSGGRVFGASEDRFGTSTAADAITLNGGGIMNLDSNLVVNKGITLLANGGTITGGWGLTHASNRTIAINGVISGVGGLLIGGDTTPAPITLSATNTYQGGTIIGNATGSNGAAVLVVSRDANLGASFGTLAFNTGQLWAGASFASPRAITMTGAGTIDTKGYDVTFAGPLSGAGLLTKASAGSLVLTAPGTATGGITLSNPGAGSISVLDLQASNAAGTGTVTLTHRNGEIRLSGGITASSIFTLSNDGQWTYGTPDIASVGIGEVTVGLRNVSGNNTVNGEIRLTSGGGATVVASDSGSLTLAGPISAIATGTRNLVLGGASGGVVSGNIANGSGTIGLAKIGSGTWAIAGTNTQTGSTTVYDGTLAFDYSTNNTSKMSAGLTMAGGTLSLIGNVTTPFAQTVSGTTIAAGASDIVLDAGQASLNLGAITRNVGGTVDFSNAGTGVISTSSPALGGWATYGNDFAIVSGGNIVAQATYASKSDVATWAAGEDITNTDAVTGFSGTTASGLSINSLRFKAAAPNNIIVGDTLTVASGGVLVLSDVGANASTISGGTLRGAAGQDLVVIQRNTGASLTIGSEIADNTTATGLTKSGAGTLVLTGTNSYTGTTYINEGVLSVTTDANLGAGSIAINGGTLRTAAGFVSNKLMTLTNDARIDAQGDTTLFGAINDGGANTGRLIKTGAGTLRLGNYNTYRGRTLIEAGTVIAGGSTSFGVAPSGVMADEIIVSDGASLQFTGDMVVSSNAGIRVGPAIGPGSITFTVTGNNVASIGPVTQNVDANVSLVKEGSGILAIAGASTFSGSVTVNQGVLSLRHAGALGTAPSVTIASGTALELQDGAVVAGNRYINVVGAGINGTGAVRNISGSNSLGGALLLGGNTTITSDFGQLTIAALVSGNGTNLVLAGDSLDAASPRSGINESRLNNSVWLGSGKIIKNDPGFWTLAGENTGTNGGVDINAGFLGVRQQNALGTGPVNVAAGAQLSFGPTGMIIPNDITLNGMSPALALTGGTDSGTIANTIAGTLTLAATSNVATWWSDKTLTIAGKVTGPGGLVIHRQLAANNAPNVVLSGTLNDYTGATTVRDGARLTITSDANLGSTPQVNLRGGGVLVINSNMTGNKPIEVGFVNTGDNNTSGGFVEVASGLTATWNGVISGSTGALNKSGAGTLILTGANTLTAPIVVSAGTLGFNDVSNLGAGPIYLNGGRLRWETGNTTDISLTGRTIRINGDVGLDANGQTITLAGGLGGFVKNGAGTFTVTGSINTATNILIDEGTAEFAGNAVVNGTSLNVGKVVTATPVLNIRDNALVNLSSFLYLGDQSSKPGTVNQSGGSVFVGGQVRIGHWPTETSTYTLSSGKLVLTAPATATNPFGASGTEQNGALYVGIDGIGILNQSGGEITTIGLVLDNRGDSTGTDQYNLTGGTINIGRWGIQGNASTQLNLGGGVIRATENWNQAVARPLILTGNGGNVTIDTLGNIALNGTLSGPSAFNKTGPGKLTLNSAAASTLTGSTIQTMGGTLEIDFANATTPATPLLPATLGLSLSNTSLIARAKNNANSTQTFGVIAIDQGASSISAIATGTGAMTLNAGSLSRSVPGGTVAFALPSAGAITTNNTTASILGGWATVGDDFAGVSTGNIVPFAGYAAKSDAATWLAMEDVTNTDTSTGFSGTTAPGASVNSIRIAAASPNTITIGDTLTVDSGGILVSSGVGANSSTITGGQLRGAFLNDLIVIQNNLLSPLLIESVIADNNSFATALTKSGLGTLGLSGANLYTGKTFINQGTLRVTASAQLGALTGPGSIVINGGTLQANASFELDSARGIAVGALAGSGSGAIDVTAGNTLTYRGVITDNAASGALGSLVKTGAGTLALEGANTYTGATVINQGTLKLLDIAAIPAAGSRDVVLNSQAGEAGVLDLNGLSLTLHSVAGDVANANFGRIANNLPATTSTLTFFSDGIETSSAMIVDNTGTGGTVALTKTGPGFTFLNSPNATSTLAANRSTYTGVTTVNAGTLAITWIDYGGMGSSIGAATSAASNLVIDGGTLSINPASPLYSDRLFTIGAAGGTLSSDSTTAANTVQLVNPGNIAMTGTGDRTFTLGGANTGTGAGVAANYNILAAKITDPASGATKLVKTGAGAWTLTNANTHTGGTEVIQGTLRLNSAIGPAIPGDVTFSPTGAGSAVIELYADNQIASTANVVFALDNASTSNWGYLKLLGRNQTLASITSLSGRGVIENTEAETTFANTVGTLTISGSADSIYNGYIRNNAGSGSGLMAVVKDGSGTLRLIGNQITYTGGTTIKAGAVALDPFTHSFTGPVSFPAGSTGKLQLGDNEITLTGLSSDTTSPGTPIVENGSDTPRTLALNLAAGASNTYAGTIRDGSGLGTLALRKTGAGSMTLAGTNSYTGGTLADNGALSFASAWPTTGTLRATGTGYIGATSAAWGANVANFLGKFDKSGTDGAIGIESSTSDAIDLTGFNRNARLATVAPAVTLSGPITPQNGTWRFGGSTGTLTITSTLADDGINVRGVDQGGPAGSTQTGTTSLTGANTYSGPTRISGGSLRVDADALPAGTLLVLSGGVLELDLGPAGNFTRPLGLTAGQVTWNAGGFAAFGNDQTVNLGGAGATINYGLANGFQAPTGTLIFGSSNADAKVTLLNPLALGGDRTIQVNDGPAPVEAELAGAISGGIITKTGAGSLTLSGANTFTGSLIINGGTVNVSSAANLGASALSLVTFTGNGTLHVTDNIDLVATATARLFISNSVSNGTIDVDAGKTLNIIGSGTNPGVACYSNSATVGYTKAGEGTWIIGSQNNQFDGNLTMLGGTVVLQNQLAIGDGTTAAQTADVLFNAPGATLALQQDADTNFFAEPVVSNSATITVDRLTPGASANHALNQLAAARAELRVGGATPVTLAVSAGSNVTTSATLATAALRVNQPGVTIDIDSKTTVNVDAAYGQAFTKTGDGALTVNGPSGVNGMTVSGGTARLTTGTSHPITNNASLEYAIAADTVSTSALSGAGSLTKSGGGTLTLAGANTYGGATNITGGTLKLAPATITKPADPTAYYSFDAGTVSGVVVANQGTATAKKGILYGGAGVSGGGVSGDAMTLSGNDSVMLIDPHGSRGVDIDAAWTVSGWFRDAFTTAENGSGWRTLFRGDATDHPIIMENSSNRLGTYVGGFDNVTTNYHMDGLMSDGWHQITAVGNGTTTTFYVDGVAVGVANDKTTADIFAVGNIQQGTQANDQPFARKIDEVYVYNTALTADEALALYRATASAVSSNFIPDTSAVTIAAGATLDLNNQNETVGSIAGDGAINLGSGTLTHGGDGASTLYGGVIGGSGSTVKTGAGVTTFSGTSAYTGATNVTSGTLRVTGSVLSSSSVNLSAGATFEVGANQAVRNLTLASTGSTWTSKVDLKTNDLIITAGTLADVINQIKQGRDTGDWNAANGITTSSATGITGLAAIRNTDDGVNPIFATFNGVAVDKDAILIKYTYEGDADMNGIVDIDDYFRIDTNYALGTPNPTYRQGDFNYDNVVNADDYFLIDAAFIGQTGALSSSPVAPALPSAGSAAVPEPGTLSLLALGAAALLGRRRRSR